jgi:uncharacterized protein YdhG (YjbR/CyaY superfamily)
MTATKPSNIDEYISGFPENVQHMLQQIRTAIQKEVPAAKETISYGMPAFNLNGSYLIYFAAYKNHISIYPAPTDKTFEKDFAAYKTSGKGTIQFLLNKPLPLDLITKIVKYRVKENAAKTKKKQQKHS